MQQAVKLSPGQFKIVRVHAEETFSAHPQISVKTGESYSMIAAKKAEWRDSWIRSGAAGYANPLLWFAKPRLSQVRCFCLCGTIDKNEENHFAVGKYLEKYTVGVSGTLFFFANDDLRYYKNNTGYLDIIVARLS
jgi:hypothetical protein